MGRPILLLTMALTTFPGLDPGGDQVVKDIGYSGAGGNRTRLDVYAPADDKDHPVVVWVHGGAWQIGDKRMVQAKPRAFNEHGFVLVSVNYRLHPAATYKDQAGDIAQAIRAPFLILHVAGRRDSRAQSEGLAARLREAGVGAKVVPAEGKIHLTINRELGEPDDAPTKAVFDFLDAQRQVGRSPTSPDAQKR